MPATDKRALLVLQESVIRELQALNILLDVWMRRTIPGQRAIVQVDGVGYY